MNTTKTAGQEQDAIVIDGQIHEFFKIFKIGSLLHMCGIRKRHGYSVLKLVLTIFALPFNGKNFYRGIVLSGESGVGKDAAYDLLKGTKFNWRKLLLTLGKKIYDRLNPLTGEDREGVLIVDDSPYDRSRSKKVELLSRVYDHSTGKYIRGFRMLTVCWSDGSSCLPLDFSLLSSAKSKNRYEESVKKVDKRCCAYQRRKEALIKATTQLEVMVNRILRTGISARYLLMDRWFTMPSIVTALKKHIDVIGMVKKTSKIQYIHNGHLRTLEGIYRNIHKRRGKAKILGSSIVTLKDGLPVKLVFVRDYRNKKWLGILSTDTHLSEAEIVRIYGKRWDIEVMFKMAKQHLKLVKEIQLRDFDALTAHTTIVFMRYLFITYRVRMETDHRTFGDLFYACCDELSDISFMESLYRILTLAVASLNETGQYCRKTVQALFDAIIDAAFKQTSLSKSCLFNT